MATEPLLIQKNRSKVMAKYYLTKIIYNGLTYFLIWYSNDEDGFLLFDQQLLVFFSVEEANTCLLYTSPSPRDS